MSLFQLWAQGIGRKALLTIFPAWGHWEAGDGFHTSTLSQEEVPGSLATQKNDIAGQDKDAWLLCR